MTKVLFGLTMWMKKATIWVNLMKSHDGKTGKSCVNRECLCLFFFPSFFVLIVTLFGHLVAQNVRLVNYDL